MVRAARERTKGANVGPRAVADGGVGLLGRVPLVADLLRVQGGAKSYEKGTKQRATRGSERERCESCVMHRDRVFGRKVGGCAGARRVRLHPNIGDAHARHHRRGCQARTGRSGSGRSSGSCTCEKDRIANGARERKDLQGKLAERMETAETPASRGSVFDHKSARQQGGRTQLTDIMPKKNDATPTHRTAHRQSMDKCHSSTNHA